jgi:hypothetical protein
MSHYEEYEAYHNYVVSLSETEDGVGALADFLFDLVESTQTQAFAWLKEALAYPDETLAKIMGGLDFADWLAEILGERQEEEAFFVESARWD